MKIIAFYLPQFHTFPENDQWWGKGFTEWTNVKKAKPLFKGHYEPRVPLNNNYYYLLDKKVWKWQIETAHKYGVYGFCFYHYWFSGKKLMHKPIELFLQNKDLDQNFCICWANETFSRRWNGHEEDVLIKQEHGDKLEWKEHFEYLLPYFLDSRYIKIDGKPLFVLYKPEIFPNYIDMFEYWNQLALQAGLPGMKFAIQSAIWNNKKSIDDSHVDYRIMFEPGFTGLREGHSLSFYFDSFKCKVFKAFHKRVNAQPISYPAYCKDILKRPVTSDKFIPGLFVNWDNTPRKGENGSVTLKNDPKIFGETCLKLIEKTRSEYKKDMIFVNAWNEWAEGCYLEPDEKYKFDYLEELRNALIKTNEFPK